MPWKPKCCKSDFTTKIDKLKFNKLIKLQYRTQAKSFAVNKNAEWQIVDIFPAWADVKTKTTPTFVDGVNRGFSVSHIFTIRYNPVTYTQLSQLTEEHWILYNDKRYKILAQQNVNEEDILIEFTANIRGNDEIELNKS